MPTVIQRVVRVLLLGPFLAAGPCLVVAAAVLWVRTETFIHSSLAIDGTVIDLHAIRPGHGSDSYAPMFQFTADDGQTYSVTSSISANPPAFHQGQHVRVLMLRDRPGTARIDSFAQLWTSTLTCSAVGLIFSVVSVVVFWQLRKNSQAAI